MPNELPRAEQFIYNLLAAADVAGDRIHSGSAPAGTAQPYVVIQVQSSGNDLYTVGAYRVWADPLFIVKAVAKTGSWSTLTATADAIDAALHDKEGTVSGGTIYECIRERPFSLIENDEGVEYRHLGGFYRVRVGA
jgi:hypothetical protein